MRIRFRLGQLILGIAVGAIGLAALVQPTALWTSVIFTMALLVFGVAILGALFANRQVRPFYVGFAVIFVLYTGVILVGNEPLVPLTTWCITGLRSQIESGRSDANGPSATQPAGSPAAATNPAGPSYEWKLVRVNAPDWSAGRFENIAQMMATWLVAAAGGGVARWFATHGRIAATDGPPRTPTGE